MKLNSNKNVEQIILYLETIDQTTLFLINFLSKNGFNNSKIYIKSISKAENLKLKEKNVIILDKNIEKMVLNNNKTTLIILNYIDYDAENSCFIPDNCYKTVTKNNSLIKFIFLGTKLFYPYTLLGKDVKYFDHIYHLKLTDYSKILKIGRSFSYLDNKADNSDLFFNNVSQYSEEIIDNSFI